MLTLTHFYDLSRGCNGCIHLARHTSNSTVQKVLSMFHKPCMNEDEKEREREGGREMTIPSLYSFAITSKYTFVITTSKRSRGMTIHGIYSFVITSNYTFAMTFEWISLMIALFHLAKVIKKTCASRNLSPS